MTYRDPPSLSSISALPKTIITLLAPRQTPAVVSPAGNSDSAVSAFTSSGFRPLTGQDYIHYTRKLCPDIIVGLADVPYGVKPGVKRLPKMVRRTQGWLAEMLREEGLDQAVFAPILPISASEQSDYLDYILDNAVSQLSGLAFYDSTLLPEIPATTALSKLPRLSLDEPSSPLDILAQISLGMDLFTLPFLGFATEAGVALSFRFPRPLSQGETLSDSAPKPLGIDMRAPVHATSLAPLLEGCNCYTCRSHHRAYVQHLLSAKEMLGWTLLQAHNYHILSEFFTSIRRSIAVGRFNTDREEFVRAYVGNLPEKAVQAPRARGYHFKGKQPDENKPAQANGTHPTSPEGLAPS